MFRLFKILAEVLYLLVQFLTRTQAGEADFDIMVRLKTAQFNHLAGDVENPHGFTHVQHEAERTPAATVLGMQLTHIPLEDLGALRRLLLLNSGEQDMDTNELMILLDRIADALPGAS